MEKCLLPTTPWRLGRRIVVVVSCIRCRFTEQRLRTKALHSYDGYSLVTLILNKYYYQKL